MTFVYAGVVSTGLQIIFALFGGWLVGHLKALDPEVFITKLNQFVVKILCPCLAVWVLGIKTDMRDAEIWRVIGVFVVWNSLTQIVCAVYVRVFEPKFPAGYALYSTVLAYNNTGIIGPVLAEAVLGGSMVSLGMLISIPMFLQQVVLLLFCFEAQKLQDAQEAARDKLPTGTDPLTPKITPLTSPKAVADSPLSGPPSDGIVNKSPVHIHSAHHASICCHATDQLPSHVQVPYSQISAGNQVPPYMGIVPQGSSVPLSITAATCPDSSSQSSASDTSGNTTATATTTTATAALIPTATTTAATTATAAAATTATTTLATATTAATAAAAAVQPPQHTTTKATLSTEHTAEHISLSIPDKALQHDQLHGARSQHQGLCPPSSAPYLPPPPSIAVFQDHTQPPGQHGEVDGDGSTPTHPPGQHGEVDGDGSTPTHPPGRHGEVDGSSSLPPHTRSRSHHHHTLTTLSPGPTPESELSPTAVNVTIHHTHLPTHDHHPDASHTPHLRPPTPHTPHAHDLLHTHHHHPDSPASSAGTAGTAGTTGTAGTAGIAGTAGAAGVAGWSSGHLNPPESHPPPAYVPKLRSLPTTQSTRLRRMASVIFGPTTHPPATHPPAAAEERKPRGWASRLMSARTRQLLSIVILNPLILSNFVGIFISLVGLNHYLDPDDEQFVWQTGFIEGTLRWFARATAPLAIFTQGLWLHSSVSWKAIHANLNQSGKVLLLLLIRFTAMPLSMAVLSKYCGLSDQYSVGLLLMTTIPVGQLAFVFSQQYGIASGFISALMIINLFTMLPHTIVILEILKRWDVSHWEVRP